MSPLRASRRTTSSPTAGIPASSTTRSTTASRRATGRQGPRSAAGRPRRVHTSPSPSARATAAPRRHARPVEPERRSRPSTYYDQEQENHVLTSAELHQLVQELTATRVLSVYLDTRVTDPAMRHAWRSTLATGLREARARITDDRDREEFERAAALLDQPFPAPGGAWGAPGWVAFITAEGRRYVADLPVQPPAMVAWRDGPVVPPYLRALKQHRPVIVALVESRSARLHCYAWAKLETIEELTAPLDQPSGAERITGSVTGATSAPAARGAFGTDEAQRRRHGSFQ